MRYDPEVAARMLERRLARETLREVAERFGTNDNSVRVWGDRYVRSGAVELVGQ